MDLDAMPTRIVHTRYLRTSDETMSESIHNDWNRLLDVKARTCALNLKVPYLNISGRPSTSSPHRAAERRLPMHYVEFPHSFQVGHLSLAPWLEGGLRMRA